MVSIRDGVDGGKENGPLLSAGVGGMYSRMVIIPNWEIRETSKLRYVGIMARPQSSDCEGWQGHSSPDDSADEVVVNAIL